MRGQTREALDLGWENPYTITITGEVNRSIINLLQPNAYINFGD
jgi:hypothetical protein